MGNTLHSGGASANNGHPLIRKAGEIPLRVATSVVVIPPAGMEGGFEGFEGMSMMQGMYGPPQGAEGGSEGFEGMSPWMMGPPQGREGGSEGFDPMTWMGGEGSFGPEGTAEEDRTTDDSDSGSEETTSESTSEATSTETLSE